VLSAARPLLVAHASDITITEAKTRNKNRKEQELERIYD
jgi:hypothetical protein